MSVFDWLEIFYSRFERNVSLQIAIIDSLLRVQEPDVMRSRERSSDAKNKRWATTTTMKNHHIDTKMKNHHIDMKMKKVTAKKQTFNNSTLRQSSQFERVQIKTTMSVRWWIQRQCLLFIELIQSRAGNEAEGETKNETENESDHQFENDEIENENKQCRKRLSRYIKTDDAKCEDAVNRLRFIKLKKLKKKTFLSDRKFFFFRDADSISDVAYLDRNKLRDKRNVLSYVINECQSNRRVMSRYPRDEIKIFGNDVRI